MPGAVRRPVRHALHAVLAVGLAAAVAGCASVAETDRANGLGKTVNFYIKAMRWGEYQAAMGLMKPRDGSELTLPTAEIERLDSVRIVSEEHQVVALDEAAREARMTAVYGYHLGASTRLRQARQAGTWWYDDDGEGWFLDGPLPGFGR